MKELVDELLQMFEAVLASGGFVSMLLGFVVAIAGTQFLKHRTPFPAHWNALRRWVIRMGALPLGFLPVFYTWPHERTRPWVALAVGLSAPAVYKLATVFLYRRFPELEAKLSAKPEIGVDETEHGVETKR